MRWHHENNYDLITIDEPLPGDWKIEAELDPDNRVMVVTDLKLATTDLPNNILIGETFDFNASLTDKNEVIVRQDFLKLVDAQVKEENEISDEIVTNLNDSQQQGIYLTNIGDAFKPGRNDVVVTMTSATFERQRRQSINVVETPFDVHEEQLTDQATRTHRLTLIPDRELIKSENLSIAAMLTAEDGSEWSYDVMKNSDGNWQLTLADLTQGEEYSLALQIRGETAKGRSLFLQPTPLKLVDRDIPEQKPEEIEIPILDEAPLEVDTEEIVEVDTEELVEIEQPESEFIEPELEPEMEAEPELEPELEENTLPAIESEMDVTEDGENITPAMKLIVGNALILVLVAVGIFMWRRKRTIANPGDQL